MTSRGTPTEYLHRLLTIARKNRVQVHFLPGDQFPDLDWDGLYLVSPEDGAGIAVRADLDAAWRDWILAHELGHHFGRLNGTLFSPFRAHKVDALSRARWGQAKRLDSDEESANAWAANTLVSRKEWESAESRNPCDLHAVTARLGLPLAAAVAWERQERRRVRAKEIRIRLSRNAQAVLDRPLNGQGGHQSFFERIQRGRKGSTLLITYRDFSLARERASLVQGGWLARYQVVLGEINPLIQNAGSVRQLFNITLTNPIDTQ